VAYLGYRCLVGSNTDKSLDLPSAEQSRAEKSSSTVHSVYYDDVDSSVTVSVITSESSEFDVNIEIAKGSRNMMNSLCGSEDVEVTAVALCPRDAVSCDSAAEQPAEPHSCVSNSCSEYAIDRELVCVGTGNTVDLSVNIASGQRTDGGSEVEFSQYSCLPASVKSVNGSNIHETSRKCTNQTSIQSFFRPVSSAQQNNTAVHSIKNPKQSTVSHAKVQNSFYTSHLCKADANQADFTETSDSTDKTRKCPFYKWIPGKASDRDFG